MLALPLSCGGRAQSGADAAHDEPPPPEQSARDALEALDTTPEQDDALLALLGKFAIVLSRSGKARRAFTQQLIDALLRGRVKPAEIDPARRDFERAINDALPEVLALIDELHGILEPRQRAELVDGLAARAKATESKRKARNQAMIDELDIGLAQKVSIAKAMADEMGALRPALEQVRNDAKQASEAFKKNPFHAAQQALFRNDLGKLYLESAVALVATLAPELEYEQRRTLANIIRHRLNGGDRRR